MKAPNQPSPEAQWAYTFWEMLQDLSDQLWNRYETEFVDLILLERLREEYLGRLPPIPVNTGEDEIPF